MDDTAILTRIHALVEQERELRARRGGLSSTQRQRLESLEYQLDQTWDLLRQRRAREELGENPDDVRERSVNDVESYLP